MRSFFTKAFKHRLLRFRQQHLQPHYHHRPLAIIETIFSPSIFPQAGRETHSPERMSIIIDESAVLVYWKKANFELDPVGKDNIAL